MRSSGDALDQSVDELHDHLLRVTGDADVAATATASAFLRVLARAADDGATTIDVLDLLRAGNAVARAADGHNATTRVRSLLAATSTGSATTATSALVDALLALGPTTRTVIDLTVRGGLTDGQIATILSLRPSEVGQLREAGDGQLTSQLGTPAWAELLGTLALAPAPDETHARIAGAPAAGASTLADRVPAPMAWAASVVVVLGVTVLLPGIIQRVGAPDPDDVAVVAAQELTSEVPPAEISAELAVIDPDENGQAVSGPVPSDVDATGEVDPDAATIDETPPTIDTTDDATGDQPDPTDGDFGAQPDEPQDDASEQPEDPQNPEDPRDPNEEPSGGPIDSLVPLVP